MYRSIYCFVKGVFIGAVIIAGLCAASGVKMRGKKGKCTRKKLSGIAKNAAGFMDNVSCMLK